jgi:hypothetical protein
MVNTVRKMEWESVKNGYLIAKVVVRGRRLILLLGQFRLVLDRNPWIPTSCEAVDSAVAPPANCEAAEDAKGSRHADC